MTNTRRLLIACGAATVAASLAKRRLRQRRTHSQLAATWIASTFGQTRARATRLGGRIANVLTAWVDSYTAAALYQNLSKLSDVELERRGIARSDLYRHVFMTPAGKKRGVRALDQKFVRMCPLADEAFERGAVGAGQQKKVQARSWMKGNTFGNGVVYQVDHPREPLHTG